MGRRKIPRFAESSPLELDARAMRELVTKAMERVIEHVSSLPDQPLHATAGGRKLAASLRVPIHERPVPLERILRLLFGRVIPATFNDESGKKFVSPESDEFSDLLYDATLSRMEATGKYTAEQLASFYKFQIVADHDYIQRIQASHKKFARIYPLYDNDVKFEVRGYTFPFTLSAAKEVQQFIYENGLGYFTHKGFGMLDVANNDSIHRAPQHVVNYA